MSLLIKAFEEAPTLLHKLREATGKTNEHCSNFQYSYDNCITLCIIGPKLPEQPPPVPPRRQSLLRSSTLIKEKPHPPLPQELYKQLPPTAPPQDPSSLEHATLREMLADLVDLLAGNAPVITQLNNHLFSSDLIPEAVHIAVETVGLIPYDRSNKMIDAVLATLKSHPNPNSAFTSLITALRKVGLNTIATKLMECLSKFMHH